ncbi:hypothetical protein Aperf_G00000119349 [Anoplocephala perfoliata]
MSIFTSFARTFFQWALGRPNGGLLNAPAAPSTKRRKQSLLRMEIIMQITGVIVVLIAVLFIGYLFMESKEIIHLSGAGTDKNATFIELTKSLLDTHSLNSSSQQLTLIAFHYDPIPNLITSLKNFQIQLNPWFNIVRNFNHSLSKIRSNLSNTPITLHMRPATSVEALWNVIEVQGQYLLQAARKFDQTLIPFWGEKLRTSSIAIISAVVGLFTALTGLIFVLLLGFIGITLGEHYFGKKSEFNNLDITDFVFNGYFREIWSKFNEETGKNLPPPKNVFNAVLNGCKQSNIGLLPLIGWNNFSATLKSFHEGHFLKVSQHWKGQLTRMIPIFQSLQMAISNEMDISQLITSLSQIAVTQNSVLTIQDLFSPKKLEQPSLEMISRNLTLIKSAVSKMIDVTDKLNQLSQRLPDIQSAMNDITEVSKSVQFMDELELITAGFLALIENLSKELKSLTNAETLISEFATKNSYHLNNQVATNIQAEFDQLFPCSNVRRVFSILIKAVCGNRGLLEEMFAWGVILWTENAILFAVLLPILFGLSWINDSIAGALN